MTNTLRNAIGNEISVATVTENGCYALNTTGDALLDLYAEAGSLRDRLDEVVEKFTAAYAEDPTLAVRLMFYTRDIRGGLGERSVFRAMLRKLAESHPTVTTNILPLVPEYGRWDDLISVFDYNIVGPAARRLIEYTLEDDMCRLASGEPISLCAKWMPSITGAKKSSAQSLARFMNVSDKEYRQMLSKLRRYLNIVETNLTEKNYGKIDYSAVPSRAMRKYKKAFMNRDEVRFEEFIQSVEKGESKINAAAVTPYDLAVDFVGNHGNDFDIDPNLPSVRAAIEQWKALPNYAGDKNVIVMCDTSGSMWGRPSLVATSLSIYFAERNTGAFHNMWMTFAHCPKFIELNDDDVIIDKFRSIFDHDIIENTNFEAAYKYILNVAVKNNVKPEDMPVALLVISDMQFDPFVGGGYGNDVYHIMKDEFRAKGYELPNIIFWNVDSRVTTFHASKDAMNVQMVSGESPTVFKNVMDALGMTPLKAMLKTLNSDRYKNIYVGPADDVPYPEENDFEDMYYDDIDDDEDYDEDGEEEI